MLHKIKTLREIIEPKSNELGISFEEMLENVNEHVRFEYFMREYKRKLNPEKYEGMNFTSNIIRLAGDCKSIKTYLEKEYRVNDSKYYDQFIDYLSEIANTRPESIAHWRRVGLLSNKDALINEYSSYEPYRLMTFKDISLLLETLNLKPLYHLNDSEFSSLINDKEYKTWLCSPGKSLHANGTIYPWIGWDHFNLKNLPGISKIYEFYIEYIVKKWITDNTDPNSEDAEEKRVRSHFDSHFNLFGLDLCNLLKLTPIIKQIIFDNPTYFKRKSHNSYTQPYADYRFDIDYDVPVPSDNLELSMLIEHFTEFKKSINQLFTDEKIEALYHNIIELEKKQCIKTETTWDRAVKQNGCYPHYSVSPSIQYKYSTYLWFLSMLEYYINNPNELITYSTLEYPNSKELPVVFNISPILNEKSYWSKSLQKWDKVKYDKLVKKTKIKIKKANKILENYNTTVIKNQVNFN